MKGNEYQKLAARTLIERPDFEITDSQIMIVWNALGLAGEAGELANLIKKGIFHQHRIDMPKVQEELGDVLWYLAAICTELGFTLDDIMYDNIEKLRVRYPNGYNAADSKARVDTHEKENDHD